MNKILIILNNLSAIFGIISGIIGLLTFFYFKNEKFYLFIQKKLTKLLKSYYPVLLKGDFSLTTNKDIEEIKKILFEKFHMQNNYIETGKEDGYFKFKITIYEDAYNKKRILISFKERTFIALIEENIRTIKELIQNILKETDSTLTKTDLFVEFISKNPYEGFFVKRLPFEKIRNFIVEIEINNSLVEAKKDKIIIRSNTLEKAFYTLEDLISFKVTLIKAYNEN